MLQINLDELSNLVDRQEWEKAQALLETLLRESLLNAEANETPVLNDISAYLAAASSLNEQHLEFLNNTIETLKELDKQERKNEDALDLEITRNQISNS